MDFQVYYLYYTVTVINDSLHFLHGFRLPKCRAVVDKRFDGYWSLQFMAAGRLTLRYDQRAWDMDGRWVWPAMPGPRIFFASRRRSQSWDHRYIAFQGPLIDVWRAEGILPLEPQSAPGMDSGFDERFDRMLVHASGATRTGRLRAINLLEALLLDLAEARAAPSGASRAWLGFVLETLSDPTGGADDYEALAASVGMSLSTLRRRFREHTGVSLHRYAINSRITAARALLLESDLPIKAVAERLGYRDVYFFNRQFRSVAGMPPGEFRRSGRG